MFSNVCTRIGPLIFGDPGQTSYVHASQEYLALEVNLGIKPHVIIFNIARKRVDANRDPCAQTGNDCACTTETPDKCLSVHREYHDKIREVAYNRSLILPLFLP